MVRVVQQGSGVFKRATRQQFELHPSQTRMSLSFSENDIKQHSSKKGCPVKDAQLLAVQSILSKQDTIVVAKTGYGKSLIYQLAISLMNTVRVGSAVIISPLVALMMDQANAAESWGPSVFLGSAQEDQQVQNRLESYRFIFLSPEKFMQTGIQRELSRISHNVSLIVIDECHCQISWQGFRDAFATLPQTIQSVFESSRPPLLLMTATLPSDQQTVLMRDFNLAQATNVIRVSCDRENLSIQIKNSNNKIEDIMEYCRTSKSNGNMVLIYVATPQDCENLLQSLSEKCAEHGLSIRKYHGAGNKGRSKGSMKASDTDFLNERKETLRLATSRQLDICICTSAFGIGIDIPHIDTVIHMFPLRSIAEFAQHIGRAGRNGCSASAIMLFDHSVVSHVFSLWIGNKDPSVMQKNFVDFQSMMSFIYSEKCRRKFVRHIIEGIEYSASLASDCNCDNCKDDHINVRETAPAMRMLLSAFQHYGEPVCISRVADALFAHAPKHRGQWNDSQTPMWGKGAALFRPTKQASIWSSLASVAVHELQFLQATLHWHVAPAGNMVVYQRLSLTAKGEQFLGDTAATLLVRERFVPEAAWEAVPARCIIEGCMNKAKGPASRCAKHKVGASLQATFETPQFTSQPDGLTSQLKSVASLQTASETLQLTSQLDGLTSQHKSVEFTAPLDRTASQLTPAGYQTQEKETDLIQSSSHMLSQVSLHSKPTPTTTNAFPASQQSDSAVKPNQKHGTNCSTAPPMPCQQF